MTITPDPLLFSEAEMRGAWPWPQLVAGAYDVIMADPPWRFSMWARDDSPPGSRPPRAYEKSPQAHYATMTIDDIAALPVAGLAAPDCLLWLWATAPMLDQQLAVLRAWGFTFKTSGVWVKKTVNAKLAFGTGYVLRNAHEPFLIGTRGEPETTRSVRSVVEGQVRAHSQKPNAAFAACERLMPGAARVELFSRTTRPGWDAWGDECGKFNTREGESS